jgi:integrase
MMSIKRRLRGLEKVAIRAAGPEPLWSPPEAYAWLEEKLRLGSLWQDNRLVFPTTTSTTTSGTHLLGRHFKPLLKRAELPAIRLYDLRHTCATILLMAGKHPKFVQEMFGHANISITLDTYSHVIEGMDGRLADAMDDAL